MANTKSIKPKNQELDEFVLEKEKKDVIEFAKSRLPKDYLDWLEKISDIIQTPSSFNNNYTIVTSADGAFYAG